MKKETESGSLGVLTVEDALYGKVKFDVPEETMLTIIVDRGLDGGMCYADADKKDIRLAYADLIKWFLMGPSKQNNTTDTDNGWSHAGGGYELTDSDRSEMKAEANAIYAELEPTSMFKKRSTFRITSHGVKRANITPYGEPVTRII